MRNAFSSQTIGQLPAANAPTRRREAYADNHSLFGEKVQKGALKTKRARNTPEWDPKSLAKCIKQKPNTVGRSIFFSNHWLQAFLHKPTIHPIFWYISFSSVNPFIINSLRFSQHKGIAADSDFD